MAGQRIVGTFVLDLYDTLVTDEMYNSIKEWRVAYEGKREDTDNRNRLRLPAIISAKAARHVTTESMISVTGDSEMAKYLNKELSSVIYALPEQAEYACAMGGLFLKPYLHKNGEHIGINFVQADYGFPIEFDSSGHIVSALFMEIAEHTDQKKKYVKIEKHTPLEIDNEKGYIITNDIYVTDNSLNVLNDHAQLSNVTMWEDIQPSVTVITDKPLFAYFKMPRGNSVDSLSPLGESIYARAMDTMRNADNLLDTIDWEVDGGQLVVFTRQNILQESESGFAYMPKGKHRLFKSLEMPLNDPSKKDIEVFNPELRDESFVNIAEFYFKRIEDGVGFSHGTLSEVPFTARTATEVIMMRQELASTIRSIQYALEDALYCLVDSMYAMTVLYDLVPDGAYELKCKWDDSLITDTESERKRDLEEVGAGIMSKKEYRVKYYNETLSQATKAINEIDQDNKAVSDDEIMNFKNTEDEFNNI